MTPIPRVATPVVWFIRWWVKKPEELPSPLWGKAALRWHIRCPLSFLFRAQTAYGWWLFGPFLTFAQWWDSQTDARAAVDAVWGKDGS